VKLNPLRISPGISIIFHLLLGPRAVDSEIEVPVRFKMQESD
jgi:hypothetical protein